MKILVFNAGSSSLKFGVFDTSVADSRIFKAEFSGFSGGKCVLNYRCGGEAGEEKSRACAAASVEAAIAQVPAILAEFGYGEFSAIGHRVAHGGTKFHNAALIDDVVLKHIEGCTPLAPLHNPANLQGIYTSQKLWANLPQVAVFDTGFHHTIPAKAYTYAVPKAWRDLGLRRYGFHGTSHKYIGLRVAQELNAKITDLKIISCHLGSGASICAINHGFSVDTSMGMTTLEGLVMATRSGDVDPGMFAYLARNMGLSAEEIEKQLYNNSGLKALTGTADMREIEARAAAGDTDAQAAIEIYVHRVRKYIGAYAAAMGGVDALAFTGGIGENSATMRRRICDRFEFLGLDLDDYKNQAVRLSGFEAPQIESEDSRVKIVVTQTAEQLMIAQEVEHLLGEITKPAQIPVAQIPVAVSARHVHLSEDAIEALFGKGYKLTKLHDLRQKGQWAANETVDVIGSKGTLKNVRILAPARKQTQVEVSRTDTFTLGVSAPIRQSGHLENTPKIRLRGAVGEIETTGLIIAARHVHMSADDAKKFGLKDGDFVDVKLGDAERSSEFSNTLIRVSDSYQTEMHIDTDEANAAGISAASTGEMVCSQTEDNANISAKQNMALK